METIYQHFKFQIDYIEKYDQHQHLSYAYES